MGGGGHERGWKGVVALRVRVRVQLVVVLDLSHGVEVRRWGGEGMSAGGRGLSLLGLGLG